jgi:hypothetical protein
MQWSIWYEARNDFEDVKKVVITNLFPSLDPEQAEDNMDLPLDSLDSSLKHQLLQSGEIQDRLAGRDAAKFIASKNGVTVADFIRWVADTQAALA